MIDTPDRTYEGWSNYATWGIALVLDNEQATYVECDEQARAFVDSASHQPQVLEGIWTAEKAALFGMEDWVKDYVEMLCGLDAGEEREYQREPTDMARQMIYAGLADVDWPAIARHYISALEN